MHVLTVFEFFWDDQVHSGALLELLGSFWRALVVVRFIRARPSVGGFIRVRWVYSSALYGTSSAFGFVGFIWACPGGGRVHLGSLCSFARTLAVVGFFPLCWVYLDGSERDRAYSVSLGSLGPALGVAVFIRVHLVHSGASLVLSGFFLVRWVHLGTP